MGRKVLKFDGPLARGLWYRPSGDKFKVSVTGFTFPTPTVILNEVKDLGTRR
jgi:hypothetical protein